MFSRLPVKKLSRQSTSLPSLISRSQRCEPINPAPPVTKILIKSPFYEKNFLAQRRKGAKRYRVSRAFLCAFASLREKYFLPTEVSKMHLSTFVQSRLISS